jgi:hypothetical protein
MALMTVGSSIDRITAKSPRNAKLAKSINRWQCLDLKCVGKNEAATALWLWQSANLKRCRAPLATALQIDTVNQTWRTWRFLVAWRLILFYSHQTSQSN